VPERDREAEIDAWTERFRHIPDPPPVFARAIRDGWDPDERRALAADAEAYAKEVVMADFEKPGDSDVMHKLMTDLAAAGKPMEDHTIRKQSEHLAGEAKKQLMAEVR